MRRFLLRAASRGAADRGLSGGDLAGRYLPDAGQAKRGQLKERLSAGGPAPAPTTRAGAPPDAAARFRHTPRRARFGLVFKANPRRSNALNSINDAVSEVGERRLRLVMTYDYGY
jgi:hypothetical protein